MGSKFGWGVLENGEEMWYSEPIFKKMSLFERIKWFLTVKKYMVEKMLDPSPSSVILDYGCGTGSYAIDLSKKRNVFIIGVDIFENQLKIARELSKMYNGNCKFFRIDRYNIPFEDNYFDGFVSLDVLGHIVDLEKALNEINRVLKPGGIGAIFSESALTKWNLIKYYLAKNGVVIDKHFKFHVNLKRKHELKKILENSGFKVERIYSLKTLLFFTDPSGYYEALKNRNDFKLIKYFSYFLSNIEKIPIYKMLSSIYTYFELFTLGRISESQGLLIKVKKI